MENGSIGEARTRSFLIDRFWILERSVDMDGADFIIQRRLTGINLLDKEPPRLGVVQVKFFNSESATQYLHKEYVLDSNGHPRNEFFLICHTGKEDESTSYLLAAKDIESDFKLTDSHHSRPNSFTIPGKMLLGSKKYKIVSNELSLNRIERALVNADFVKNRRFMSWALPGIGKLNETVNPIYQEPLDNWDGDIPDQFVDLKKKTQRAIFDIEEALEKLNEILETDDPEKALGVAEEIYYDYRGAVSIPDDLFDEDFYNVVREHKERHAKLHGAGLLDPYLRLQKECIQFICSDLAQHMELDRETAYILTVTYNADLSTWSYSSELRNIVGMFEKQGDEHWSYADAPATEGILSISPGSLIAYILAGRYGYQKYIDGQWVDEPEKSWEEKLGNVARISTREIMYKVYYELFGE